jgi:hypothetical protein
MRIISDTLLAAAQSWRAEAVVQCAIANRRPRYVTLHQGAGGARYLSDLLIDDDSGYILRVLVDGSGNVRTARVQDPNDHAAWTAWTTQQSDAHPAGDCALARVGYKQYRLFYVDSAGNVVKLSSTDGSTWGSKTTVVATGQTATRLAAADQYLALQYANRIEYTWASWGGSWAAATVWSGVSWTARRGIGCDYDAVNNRLYLLAAYDGRVVLGWRNLAAGTWSGPFYANPGAAQTPPASASPADPAILVTANNIIATWVDRNSTSPWSWDQPMARRCYDGAHLGDEVALAVQATTMTRLALAKSTDINRIWLADEDNVLYTWDYDADNSSHYQADLDVVRYARNQPAGRLGRLSVTLLDASAHLKGLATLGDYTQPIQPLAEVQIARGYRTSAGDETLALEPYYLVGAHYGLGQEQQRVTIEAVDGWGLLALWRPEQPLIYYGQTMAWLLAEILAQVGLGYADDGDAALNRTIGTYVLAPERTARQALEDLLLLAGAVAYWDANGVCQVRNLASYAPASQPTVGDQGEVLRGGVGRAAYEVTAVKVAGSAHASAVDDVALSMALGLRLFWQQYDQRITASTVTETVKDRQLALAQVAQREDRVVVPLRPDLEPWDVITLRGDEELLPASDRERLILGIEEHFDATRDDAERYVTRLQLGARPS